MAMERMHFIRETHTRSITALGYNPARREILMGCEDGVVKSWEADTGKAVSTFHEHRGWVTDFLYWPDTKVMFSSANDGVIIAWGSGGGISDRILLGQPVYCMALNPRRHQLVCGVNAGIRVHELDDEKDSGHYIHIKPVSIATEHTDIVRCLVCHESRVYSGGYDQKLVIYDSTYTGDKNMKPIIINNQAHDAGISCLMLVRDNENNTWVVTGSFDKTVRVWSPDGKLVHKLDGFLSTVTGVCYVPWNKTIWAAGGMSHASLYDPRSGENVSDFIGTFQTQEEEKYVLQLLKFFPELNSVVACTSRRHLLVWKYNSSGCITALKNKTPLESMAYTGKVPILLFSGDHDGSITKWERMQSNHFMYSKEHFQLADAKKAALKKKKKESSRDTNGDEQQRIREQNKRNKAIQSRYTFNKPTVPPMSIHNHPNTSILRVEFVEELDLIVAACEDRNLYVWGFDEDAVKALKTMEPPDEDKDLVRKFAVLLSQDSELLEDMKVNEEDSVTNRVAGFICKHTLSEHLSCVTCLAIVGKSSGYKATYVLSAGWDRRICIWNLETGQLEDVFRNPSLSSQYEHVEIAADGIITDLAYCPPRNEFAYSSSDKMVYIRKFSLRGQEMVLLNTLQGHFAEVTCVCWNKIRQKWVTGSEDGTIRIWSGEGLNESEQVLAASGAVTAMCIDKVNGAVVAGIQHTIRVYESEEYRLVQTNVGHTDSVRAIIHIPERKQYVSSSWDKTVRVWNAWKLPKKRRKTSKERKAEEMSWMNGILKDPLVTVQEVEDVGENEKQDNGEPIINIEDTDGQSEGE